MIRNLDSELKDLKVKDLAVYQTIKNSKLPPRTKMKVFKMLEFYVKKENREKVNLLPGIPSLPNFAIWRVQDKEYFNKVAYKLDSKWVY